MPNRHRRDRSRSGVLLRGFATLIAVLLAVAACDDTPLGPCCDGGGQQAVEPFEFGVDVRDLFGVLVESFNGDVRIIGVPDDGTAVVRGERRVTSFRGTDAGFRLDDIAIELTEEEGELVVRTFQPPDDRDYAYVVHYEILVPEWFIARVLNVNGLITIEDLSSGAAVVNTNGPVELFGLFGSAFVDNINGDIVADVIMDPGGFIDFRTVNGHIALDIPVETSALFDAVVVNGEISVRNLLLRDRVEGAGFLSGRFGAGDGEIVLSTTNGDISVRGF